MGKKFWSALLTTLALTVMLALFATLSVSAATTGGTFGEDGAAVKWSFDNSKGTLTISGTGDMADASLGHVAPWSPEVIKTENFDGLTSIDGIFSDWSDLFTVRMVADRKPTLSTENGNGYITVSSSNNIFLADDTDFLDNNPIEISFDFKASGTSGGNGILSLNDRTGGKANEMRILSEYNGYITFSGDSYINLFSVKDRTDWISVKVIVYPETYDSVIFIDGRMVLFTVSTEEGHMVLTVDSDGALDISEKSMTHELSPFYNLSGEIEGIYFFHYVNKTKMLDNVQIRRISAIDNVVAAGQTIGEYAFAGITSLEYATVASSVSKIGERAFYFTALSEIRILSDDVEIYDSADTIPASATIYGRKGSSAQAYAQKYDRRFVEIQ